jgi:hypothetical protein
MDSAQQREPNHNRRIPLPCSLGRIRTRLVTTWDLLSAIGSENGACGEDTWRDTFSPTINRDSTPTPRSSSAGSVRALAPASEVVMLRLSSESYFVYGLCADLDVVGQVINELTEADRVRPPSMAGCEHSPI